MVRLQNGSKALRPKGGNNLEEFRSFISTFRGRTSSDWFIKSACFSLEQVSAAVLQVYHDGFVEVFVASQLITNQITTSMPNVRKQ